MPKTDFEVPDSVPEDAPSVVGTPEGDNEFPPGDPISPLPDGAEQKPSERINP